MYSLSRRIGDARDVRFRVNFGHASPRMNVAEVPLAEVNALRSRSPLLTSAWLRAYGQPSHNGITE
jgi:hypothetical protein